VDARWWRLLTFGFKREGARQAGKADNLRQGKTTYLLGGVEN
jgi:hypothetical protein